MRLHCRSMLKQISLCHFAGSPAAEASVMQAGVAQKALSLLIRFPFNNLLHAQVTSLVLHALDSGTPAIVDHLFNTCNLVSTPV